MSYPAIMTERYQLSLSAYFKRLLRVSSAYASVKIVSGPRKGTDLGETECIPNSFNPDWCKVFFLDFDPDDNTALEITIWDFQHGSAPWRVGGARLNAAEVYRKKGAQAKIGTKGASL
jgi:Ca2+-dependent lipid-binding protein